MRARVILLATATLMSSCSRVAPVPSAQLVDRIEAKLALDPCIGSLSKWHREYRYRHPANKPVDLNDIRADLTEAGPQDPAGRFVLGTDAPYILDDRPIMMAFATYDVRRDQLTLTHCGPNFGPPTAERVIQ